MVFILMIIAEINQNLFFFFEKFKFDIIVRINNLFWYLDLPHNIQSNIQKKEKLWSSISGPYYTQQCQTETEQLIHK